MAVIQKVIQYRYISLLIFIVISSCAQENEIAELASEKWVSKIGSDSEVWFQNWGSYDRLFVVLNTDTVVVEPSQYTTQVQGKPYLMPKPYPLVNKQQYIGNITWLENPVWSNNFQNKFSWIIDRANPKVSLPKKLTGMATQVGNSLFLEISENDSSIINLELSPIYTY